MKRQYVRSIDYIEHMLREQLIAAIGKQVTPDDFGEYMKFHNSKLFNQNFKYISFKDVLDQIEP